VDVLAIIGAAMQDDLQRLSSASQNLANLSTAGYKREIHVPRGFDVHLQEASSASTGRAPVTASEVVRDWRPGLLSPTGNRLDLAIDGEGYFEVMTERGVAYTRQGNVHIDARGRLVTAQDAVLMGENGELRVTNAPLTVQENGDVVQEGHTVGHIKLQRFANPQDMVALGSGMYSQGGAHVADSGAAGRVRAGYQENPNVNSTQEMVHLMETMRHFEALQRATQAYDGAVQKAIHKLGEF
jgi:flagellar basal-body rod protein FlgF